MAAENIYQNKGCNDSPMIRFNRDICSNDMNIDISTRYRDITTQNCIVSWPLHHDLCRIM